MTDDNKPHENAESREAEQNGERPDLGRVEDKLKNALQGTDSGSDTRAGSLRGGSASGSDDDEDSTEINAFLAEKGRELKNEHAKVTADATTKSRPQKDGLTDGEGKA